MTFWDQEDSKGPINDMDTLKQKKIKINNIHCERGFLYIFGGPGP